MALVLSLGLTLGIALIAAARPEAAPAQEYPQNESAQTALGQDGDSRESTPLRQSYPNDLIEPPETYEGSAAPRSSRALSSQAEIPFLGDADQQGRRPVALCLLGDAVIVACEETESLVVVDARRRRPVGRVDLGDAPSALVRLDAETFGVTLRRSGQLARFRVDGVAIEPLGQVPVAADPVAVTVATDGTVAVGGMWSRELSIAAAADQTPHLSVRLPFAIGALRLLDDPPQIVATGAFGSQLALIDPTDGSLVREVDFYGHRIRGLVDDPDGRRLLVTHQLLNPTAVSTQNNIHWGVMLSNDLRWLDRDAIQRGEDREFYAGGRLLSLGQVGAGGADPNGLVLGAKGTLVIPLGGGDEVAIGTEADFELARLPTGRNPYAAAVDESGQTAWIANRLDDTLTVIDVGRRQVVETIALAPARTLSAAQRGERLFHDSRLSHDGWMSCASCHPAGHAINERADNFSDGSYGTPKRVLSVLGLAGTAPFGWMGHDAVLEEQIARSVQTTMQGRRPLSDREAEEIAAFLMQLPPPPPLAAFDPPAEERVKAGRRLFEQLDCANCHAPPTYTTADRYDVGLVDESGEGRFNPPSLRGVSQRGPRYFHDLSAPSLSAVFSEHRHQLEEPLEAEQLEALLAFLSTL